MNNINNTDRILTEIIVKDTITHIYCLLSNQPPAAVVMSSIGYFNAFKTLLLL